MTLPPRHLVEDAILQTVLPPAGAAAVVLAVGLLVFGRKAAPYAAAVGFVAAWAVALYAKPIVPWVPTLTTRVEWIPILAAGGAVAGLFGRCGGGVWAKAVWAAVLTLSVVRVCPEKYRLDPWWAVPAGAVVATLVGFVPRLLARRNPGAGVPLSVSFCLYAAAGVAIHAHSARLMDMAVVAGSALFGLAVVSLVCRCDTGGAFPGAAVVLGGTMLCSYFDLDEESKVPASSFLLPLLAPLGFAVAYLPGIRRLDGWKMRVVQFAVVSAPLVYAVWAATAEKLDFENL